MSDRGDAPCNYGRCHPTANTDPVDHATSDQEPERVSEAEPRDDVSIIRLGPLQFALERRREDAQHLTVDVVDRRRDEE